MYFIAKMYLGYEICKDTSTCGFTNAIQFVRIQNLFRNIYVSIDRFKVSLPYLKKNKLLILHNKIFPLYNKRFHML